MILHLLYYCQEKISPILVTHHVLEGIPFVLLLIHSKIHAMNLINCPIKRRKQVLGLEDGLDAQGVP